MDSGKRKQKTVFVCKNCGADSPKWLGKCPSCGSWNCFSEQKISEETDSQKRLVGFSTGPVGLGAVQGICPEKVKTGIGEFDRLLGGGITPSSLLLLGGPPGIGKSTLMLQVAARLATTTNATPCLRQGSGTVPPRGGMACPVLYVSGEESLEQVGARAKRLGLKDSGGMYFMSETNLEKIIEETEKLKPGVLIVDSIQTAYKNGVAGPAGSVAQVRECAAELLHLSKGRGITVFLLGHITKEGDLAGPSVLEHIVDTVLYFEAEKSHTYRILRCYKNRFGPTSEIGVFEMKGDGLAEVPNPSALFLSERADGVPGSAVTAVMEGTRPLLVEIQALVSKTNFGLPRRVTTGIDYNRSVLLISILENRAGLGLESQDVFINVAGGARLKEPSSDLAVCCAVFSAFAKITVPGDTVFIGEVGLGGEIRGVGFAGERIKESAKLGFKKIFLPKINEGSAGIHRNGIQVVPVGKISEIIEIIRKFADEVKKC